MTTLSSAPFFRPATSPMPMPSTMMMSELYTTSWKVVPMRWLMIVLTSWRSWMDTPKSPCSAPPTQRT